MRKVILNVAVSLDGFIEGPNGEYDWCFADQDYGMEAFLADTDCIFIGRKSFDLIKADMALFPVEKVYIFSDTLSETELPTNAEIIRSQEFDEKVNSVINSSGKNIWLFGGAQLVTSFIHRNLLGELLLAVHPIILGAGKQLFADLDERVQLQLLDQTVYDTGLLQIRYAVKPRFDADMLEKL